MRFHRHVCLTLDRSALAVIPMLRATQEDGQISKRHARECRQLLVLDREAEMPGIKRHRASNVLSPGTGRRERS
jgi:hypothetical protein